jgi:hypothetical protein
VLTNIWSLWHKIISNRKTQPKCWLAQGKEYQKTSTKRLIEKQGKAIKENTPTKHRKRKVNREKEMTLR